MSRKLPLFPGNFLPISLAVFAVGFNFDLTPQTSSVVDLNSVDFNKSKIRSSPTNFCCRWIPNFDGKKYDFRENV